MAASGGVGPVGPAVLASLGSLLLPSYHLALPILILILLLPWGLWPQPFRYPLAAPLKLSIADVMSEN